MLQTDEKEKRDFMDPLIWNIVVRDQRSSCKPQPFSIPRKDFIDHGSKSPVLGAGLNNPLTTIKRKQLGDSALKGKVSLILRL